MVAERLKVQELPRERKVRGEADRLNRGSFQRDTETDLARGLGTTPGFLSRLFREAADAIRAAEARAAAMEQDMNEAVRAEQIRAEAAEDRAKAAEDRLVDLEERIVSTIRALERRVEAAEARAHAAENWVARVRDAVERPAELRQ